MLPNVHNYYILSLTALLESLYLYRTQMYCISRDFSMDVGRCNTVIQETNCKRETSRLSREVKLHDFGYQRVITKSTTNSFLKSQYWSLIETKMHPPSNQIIIEYNAPSTVMLRLS